MDKVTDKDKEKAKAKERIETMKKTSIIIGALMLVLAVGCKNQNQQAATNPSSDSTISQPANNNVNTNESLTPEQLGELGAKIKKNPGDANKILSDAGLTQQSFEQQVRKVAEDPAASKRYAAAYKSAV
jgi:hypothetical protein